jgi:hypothetical protein
MEAAFFKQWNKLPVWCQLVLSLAFLFGSVHLLLEANTSPEQKALNECKSRLSKAAGGAMSGDDLYRMCIQIQQKGG